MCFYFLDNQHFKKKVWFLGHQCSAVVRRWMSPGPLAEHLLLHSVLLPAPHLLLSDDGLHRRGQALANVPGHPDQGPAANLHRLPAWL